MLARPLALALPLSLALAFGLSHCATSADVGPTADAGALPDVSFVDEGLAACAAAVGTKSSVGCDYWVVPGIDPGAPASCFAAFVANPSPWPAHVTVEHEGRTYRSVTYVPKGSGPALSYEALGAGAIPPGGVAIAFLSSDDGDCPRPPAESGETSPNGGRTFAAWHLTTDAPVTVAFEFPFGGGKSAYAGATLALPTSAWGTTYVATSGWGAPNGPLLAWITVVAREETDVSFVPAVDLSPSLPRGVPITTKLRRGEAVRWLAPGDPSGSTVTATKPIAVFGGHGCAKIDGDYCDAILTQVPPLAAVGHEYAAVRNRDRHASDPVPESVPWQLVGAAEDVELVFDPPQAGAPTTLRRGQVVDFHAAGPFTVKSQDAEHPFLFGARMTGCWSREAWLVSPEGCAGDAEFTLAIPTAQFLANYTFFADPTYPETELLFVRVRQPDGTFHPVTLDCRGPVDGWAPIGSEGKYELAHVAISTGAFAPVGACATGARTAKSDVPFGLTVWGWGTAQSGGVNPTDPGFSMYVSYAYAAGAGVSRLNGLGPN